MSQNKQLLKKKRNSKKRKNDLLQTRSVPCKSEVFTCAFYSNSQGRPQARTNYLCEPGTPQGKILCVHSNFPSLSSATLFCCHGDIVTLTCWREIRDKPGYVLCNCCWKTGHCGSKKKEAPSDVFLLGRRCNVCFHGFEWKAKNITRGTKILLPPKSRSECRKNERKWTEELRTFW